jgi:hypothetical protein
MVKAIALALVVAGCGGGQKPTAPVAGSDQAPYAKKVSLSWGIAPSSTKSDVFLQATDETGKQTSYPLGSYDGACKVIAPAPAMKAATGVSCGEVEIDAVIEGADVIVLKGSGGDPMAREEVTRIAVPPGAKIEVAS